MSIVDHPPPATERLEAEPGAGPRESAAAPAPGHTDVERLRERLQEAEETLRAIRLGEVDAVVIQTPEGPRTYTLVTADQTYRMLVEQMREPALTLSDDGLILYSNGRVAPLLGLDRRKVMARPLAELAPDEARASILALVERGRREEASGEVPLRHADGSLVAFQLSLSPLDTGTFHGICAVLTDLTETKRREQAAAEERLTRAIIEFAATAITVCDPDGRILRANRMATELFGATFDHAMFDALFDAGPRFAELIAAAGTEGELSELWHVAADGRTLFLEGRARPIGDVAATEATRWVVTLADVTQRHEIEAERARLLAAEHAAREHAEAANQAKSQFLAVMSHELRTPLTAIIGYADLITAGVGGEPTEAQKRYVERIKGSAWHLLHLIEGILEYARIEAGKETTTIAGADVARIAREAAALVEVQAASKGLELALYVPETLPAPTDAEKLKQILANLLANAVKFTDHGRIELLVERSGGYAICTVSDTGPGIAPEDVPRIFEPFTQVDQSATRRAGGAGLGLAIARHFADMIGAEIHVSSRKGEGTSFTVKVPLE